MDRRDIQKQEQPLIQRGVLQQLQGMIHLMFCGPGVRDPERHPPVAVLEIARQDPGERYFFAEKNNSPNAYGPVAFGRKP
ncbi:hypothetical protein D3C75_824840 [compost metagenome]